MFLLTGLLIGVLVGQFDSVIGQQTNFINHINKIQGYAETQWFLDNIPFVELPDPEIEEIYYYRWSSHKRHLRYTAPGAGYMVTEFVNDPGYGDKFGAIPAAAGHHIYETRWLRNKRYVQDYINFWTREEGGSYTSNDRYKEWVADAAYNSFLLDADVEFLKSQQAGFVRNFYNWNTNYNESVSMYFISPAWDAMEFSCSSVNDAGNLGWGDGVGYRPSFNGEMYGNALAIARVAQFNQDEMTAMEFQRRADDIRKGVLEHLWDPDRKFFYHMQQKNNPTNELLDSREEIGFFAWRWNLPDNQTDHVAAWEQLLDEEGFNTKFGPTTCEVRSAYYDDDQPIGQCCFWNGNSWPYSTGFTLSSLANLLRNYQVGPPFTSQDYFDLLKKYALTHYKNGKPYVAECHSPTEDHWICDNPERSEHYAHSTYTDNVLAELIGIQPQEDDTFVVDPIVPGNWRFFAAENIPYHGHEVTVLYDADGSYYESGHSGLQIFVNGQFVAAQDTVGRMSVPVPPPIVSISNGPNKVENIAANVHSHGFPHVSVSFNGVNSNPWNLLDGRIVYDAHPINRWSNFDSGSDTDWLMVDFGPGRIRTFDSVKMYIFSDVVTNEGRCDCPTNIVVEYFDQSSSNWMEVSNPVPTPTVCAPNEQNLIKFDSISTQMVRVNFTRDIANDYYIGITEFEIWTVWPTIANNVYEAEDGIVLNSKIEATSMASAGAYVNVAGVDGEESSVEFTGIWCEQAGLFSVQVYFANGQDVEASQILIVNNLEKLTVNYFPTQGWDQFQNYVTLELNLQRGNNVLIFNYQNYAVQMDRITLS